MQFQKLIKLLALSACCICYIACSKKKAKRISAPPVKIALPDSTTQIRKPPLLKPLPPIATQVAGLQQTGCYGKCPEYEYKVFNDGRVTYFGRKHVAAAGIQEAHVSPELLKQLLAYAELVGLFEMPDRFPPDGKDILELPGTINFVKKDGREKTITNRYDAPKALEDYESFFLNIMKSLRWEVIE